MSETLRVLIIEDSEDDMQLLLRELRKSDYDLEYICVDTESALRGALEDQVWDIIISDYVMPQFDGIAALKIFKSYNIDIPFIIVSGTIGEEVAVEAMRSGAHDYLIKGKLARLLPAVERELREARSRLEKLRVNDALHRSEAVWRSLVENLPNNVVLLDLTGVVNFVRFVGREAEPEVKIGSHILSIVHEHHKESFSNALNEIRENLETVHFDIGTENEGDSRWWSIEIGPILEQDELTGFVLVSTDISSRVQTQEALKASEERWRSLVYSMPDRVMVFDFDAKIEFVSELAPDLTLEDVLGHSVLEYLPKEHHAGITEAMTRVRKTEKSLIFEAPVLSSQRTRWWSHCIAPMKQNNKMVGFLSISSDITERKQAEDSLQVSEERYQLALAGTNDAIWDWNIIDDEFYASPRLMSMLGYEEHIPIKSTQAFHDDIHPEDADRVEQAMRAHLERNEPYGLEHRMKTATGEYKWFRSTGRALWDEAGKAYRVVGSIADISERKQAELELAEYRDHLEDLVKERTSALNEQAQIIEQIHDAVITVEVSGEILGWNQGAERLFGYKVEQVLGLHISTLFDHHNHVRLESEIFDPTRKEGGYDLECEMRHQSGEIFDGHILTSMLYNATGESKGVIFFIKDISERKRVARLKTEFVSTVSHELRTPLTSVRGALGLIMGGVGGDLPAKAEKLVAIAHKNTERLLVLINDILDMERMETGRMNFRFQRMAVGPFIELAIEVNQAYASQYGVTIVLRGEMENLWVLADSTRLTQVVTNLLSNAIKFSPKSGQVEVTAELKDRVVRFSVLDHGAGIPEAFQSQLFEKFTQADSSSSRQTGGSGLGLSIAKAIVESHGGRIGYQVPEAGGTLFYFDLPLALEDQNKSESVTTPH
ncbi:MAG: hypothetical protein BMS9Abin36_0974 [Gammaproteobacteria bacterium]|nr:MAG: hypothetical protein BMS9Abin36_0974 [Gammaproteobacteria bacterium]